MAQCHANNDSGGRYPQLVELLEVARRRIGRDPRDRVFALLGMVSDADTSDLSPNYDLEMSAVFLKAARHFACLGDGTVGFLSEAGTMQQLPDLPSWAPNLTTKKVRDVLSRGRRARPVPQHAAGDTAAVVRPVIDQKILLLNGGIPVTIQELGCHLWT